MLVNKGFKKALITDNSGRYLEKKTQWEALGKYIKAIIRLEEI